MHRTSRFLAASAFLLSLAAAPAFAQFVQQGAKLVGSGAVGTPVYQGICVAVSADGNTAAVGGVGDNGDTGAVWVYTRSNGVWSQQGLKLTGSGAVGAAAQGTSVALSADGNTLISGGRFDNGSVGAAWVFTRSGGVWTQQGSKLVGSGAVGAGEQGLSVALSADGNTAMVGAYFDDGGRGAAWVFTRSGGVWSQQGAKLVGSGDVGGATQGGAVALSADGSTALVGGSFDDGGRGAAWVYTRSGGVWSQQGPKLVGTGATGNPRRGASVDLSGDGNTAVIGGPNDGVAGAAWVFTRAGGTWSQQGAKLVGSGAVGSALQGRSVQVSADGNIAVVGGLGDDSNSGAVWAFARRGGTWHPLGAKLVGSGATGAAGLGMALGLSADGNTLIAGGNQDGARLGAAWVFVNPLAANCQFASSVLSYSSQFDDGSGGWHTTQALGPPDVYPGYGDDGRAWASAGQDDHSEYLDVAFTTPARINFVNVYETFAPGAIDTISVKNPNTGEFEPVWTGTAAAAPAVSRLFTATFATTPYPVSQVHIHLNSPAVPDWNEIDAVGIGYRDHLASSQWAAGVAGFSSQGSITQFSAAQAVGAPNVFPNYGDIGSAWSSRFVDAGPEFLDMFFSTPMPINVVNVVETFHPGALNKVSVKNPTTGLWELVWSGTAAPAPELSRINTISFPEPHFLVSGVLLEFDSPAVPGYNEVDAVGIGRCSCSSSALDVPAPPSVPAVSAIEWARPNPFTASTGIHFSLAREGRTKVEVFDLLGQRVAGVLDQSLAAGPHDVRWDGRGTSGRSAPSGVYYVRIEAPGLSGTRKVVKIN